MLLDDVNEMFGTNIEEENIDTIGGWLSTQVDTPPRVGQKLISAMMNSLSKK